MGAPIAWLLEVMIMPGQLETLQALMEEIAASTHAEPGALRYEWLTGDDDRIVHLHEQYADSAATLAHLDTFGERFAGRFLAVVDPTRLTVTGRPSDEVKAALSGFGPTFLRPLGGFVRKASV